MSKVFSRGGLKVILVAGLPLMGKSTLAKLLSSQLQINHIDIDDSIRLPIFGRPDPNPYSSPEKREKASRQMGLCYDLLVHAIDAHLDLGLSIIATATFSRALARENILKVMEKYPTAELKVIWLNTKREDIEIEEVKNRLAKRIFGVNYFSGCNSLEHYLDDKKRYLPMDLPHIEIDSFPPCSVEACLSDCLTYINAL